MYLPSGKSAKKDVSKDLLKDLKEFFKPPLQNLTLYVNKTMNQSLSYSVDDMVQEKPGTLNGVNIDIDHPTLMCQV